MDRVNEENGDLIELGSVTGETKGFPGDQELDVGITYRNQPAGLSND